MTHRDPNAASRRDRDHDRNAFKDAAIAAEGAPAWIRTRTSFIRRNPSNAMMSTRKAPLAPP